MLYIISYDLRGPDQNYEGLWAALRNGRAAHPAFAVGRARSEHERFTAM